MIQGAIDYKPNEINESVREQELQMKIRENETLHEQVCYFIQKYWIE